MNVKNLDPTVVARLAEQAAAEGMSQQEWLRQVLARTASRLSPAELVRQRETVTPMSHDTFVELTRQVAARRRRAVEHAGAPGRRR